MGKFAARFYFRPFSMAHRAWNRELLPEWVTFIEIHPGICQFQLFRQCLARNPASDNTHCFMLTSSIIGTRYFAQQVLTYRRVVHCTQHISKFC
jgi:hypothetical protein